MAGARALARWVRCGAGNRSKKTPNRVGAPWGRLASHEGRPGRSKPRYSIWGWGGQLRPTGVRLRWLGRAHSPGGYGASSAGNRSKKTPNRVGAPWGRLASHEGRPGRSKPRYSIWGWGGQLRPTGVRLRWLGRAHSPGGYGASSAGNRSKKTPNRVGELQGRLVNWPAKEAAPVAPRC
jgi:hypothetical protein